jgi:hypothetical protein
MYFTYEVQEAAVPCPEACVPGLNDFAAEVSGLSLNHMDCGFDADREAGFVGAAYPWFGLSATAFVVRNGCSAMVGTRFLMSRELSNAEQVSCAQLAVEILPGVDENNCPISPP